MYYHVVPWWQDQRVYVKHILRWMRSQSFKDQAKIKPQERKETYNLHPGLQPLRKHAYSNILKISPLKTESFQIKISDIFHISAQNIDCGYSLEPPWRGGSNEYPQSTFLSQNKKNNVYSRKPQFYYIKVGLRGSNLYRLFLWCYYRNKSKNITNTAW